MDPNFNIETAYFEDVAAFTIPVKVASGTKTGHYPLTVEVTFTTCSDKICYPPKTEEFTTDVGVGVPSNGGSSDGTIIKKNGARNAEEPALGLKTFSGTTGTSGTSGTSGTIPRHVSSTRSRAQSAEPRRTVLAGRGIRPPRLRVRPGRHRPDDG
jgi:thiol:disulfide interchange protein